MNKVLIVALSKLLKIEESVIEAALAKADGDDSIIKAYTDKHQAYTLDELNTLLKNSNKAYLEKADFEINDVPKNLYAKIAGAALESREKKLASEYGVKDYTDLNDLLAKAIESKTGKGVDEQSKQQIETLKANILKLEQDKNSEIETLKNSHENEYINRDLSSALSILPFDQEGDALDKQRKLFGYAFASEFKVARKNGKTVVLDKTDKVVVDKLGDPSPISDVMKGFAVESGFKFKEEDHGGRGAGSSSGSNNQLKGVAFDKVLEAKGIKALTDEADKVYVEWTAANKTT